ncbi:MULTISPECIES: DUF6368 family protein [Streptomyces]|jgi:hypothetical protein|uniref:DUF6368 family protein n=1 Tax=Streptomyces TaxID=1883 RepID=UPI0011640B01|nr:MULTISPECIES: DUF6368 family protein [Streptomyces]MCX4616492.1 DUF6368 family protein [Streptomyces mirabilis]MCX5346729.1 DUF6368 family protein [Streptomyces mirabilis]QDN54450.1 hypothetical protein FNV67_02640 [Streptomyces sp. S1D4-20]QDN64632.1 hypothetical protein FNV66_02270 [Streptomyces sp. S1D4-14]QDO47039.1 hypothetical protein FNV60_00505 [Streptomyces sp. RLB3-5]
MSGPVLTIELAKAVPHTVVQQIRELLLRSSARFEEKRFGEYDLSVDAGSLGITDTEGIDGRRPIMVSLMGPDVGDKATFDAEHVDQGGQQHLLGFTPTHAVNVIAFCSSAVDHVVTAVLTAAIMDLTGGVANAELAADQVAIVAELPGVIVVTPGSWPVAYGSAEFLRAWAEQPGFRLLK